MQRFAAVLLAVAATAPAPAPAQDEQDEPGDRHDQQRWGRDVLARVAAGDETALSRLVGGAPDRATNLARDLLRAASRSGDGAPVDAAGRIAAHLPAPARRRLADEVARWRQRTDQQRQWAAAYEDAMERAQQALSSGRSDDAVRAGESARDLAQQLGEPYLEARARSVCGAGYRQQSRWDRGIAEFTVAAAKEDELSAGRESRGDREQLTALYEQRAAERDERGDYQGSLEDWLQALAEWQLLGRRDQQGRLLVTLGGQFSELARFRDAEDVLQRALDLLPSGAPRGRALAALGLCLSDQALYERAEPLLLEARALARDGGDAYGDREASRHLARIWLETGRLDLADAALRDALALPADRLADALAWALRGEVARRADRPSDARAHFERALQRGEGLPEGCWRARAGLARLLEDEDPARARQLYVEAVADLEALRRQLRLPALRARALGERRRPYLGLARLSVAAGDFAAAFAALEHLHGRTLWEATAGRPMRESPDEGGALAAVERQLRACDRALAAGDPAERPRLLQQRDRLRGEHERLLVQLRLEDPRREVLAGRGPVELAAVQRALGDGEVLLVYGLLRERGVCLVVRREAVRGVELPVGERRIGELVRDLTEPMRELAAGRVDTGNLRFCAPAAQALHEQLLAPLALGPAQRLWIVADGAMQRLPFALLVSRREVRPVDLRVPYAHYGGCRYLIEDLDLARLPTAALLVAPRPTPRPADAGGRVLVFGGALPGAAAEAAAVAANYRRRPFTGSERDLLARMVDCGTVHFATHAELDAGRPSHSRLAVPTGPGTSGAAATDGWLHAYELDGLSLPGSLVVLSGCDTAGAAGAGDGLLGLSRAFLAAGARAVVATDWPVADRASAELMEDFHARVSAGDPVRALAAAQREMLAAGRRDGSPRSHPYFWAGYAVHGRP